MPAPSGTEQDRTAHQAALAFERDYYGRAVAQAAPHPLGLALRDDRFPRAHIFNQLRVTTTQVGADELLAALDTLQGHLTHRVAFVEDEALGSALAPLVRAVGFQVERHQYMVLQRPRDREPLPGLARAAAPEEHAAVEAAVTREYPHGKEERVVADLAGARAAVREQVETLRIVGPAGSPPVAHATLMRRDGVAQLEDVATFEAARGRGIARAVCSFGVDAAGADLLFLVADADDWPKQLYAKLGFDRVGTSWNFTKV